MASKLEKFLHDNKIDQRWLLVASQQAERLRSEDRKIKLIQRQARKSEDGKKPEGLAKPRSGRPVTSVGLRTALSGGRVSGPAKTRILRAVNRVLGQRKKKAVMLAALFDAPAKAPTKAPTKAPAKAAAKAPTAKKA